MRKLSFFILISFIFIGFMTAATITVTSPHTGDTWYKGKSYTIRWTKTGTMSKFVKIKLRNSNSTAVALDIISRIPNNGSYSSWFIPASVAPGNYVIRVRTTDNEVYGDSTVFTIANPHASNGSITIKSPYWQDCWKTGSTHMITWTKTGSMDANVLIGLYDKFNNEVLDITDNTANDGSYKWKIPLNIANGKYRIWVETVDNTVSGKSKPFSVSTPPQPAAIKIIAPKQNDVIGPDKDVWIIWKNEGMKKYEFVEILLMRVDAGYGHSISSRIPNTGMFLWRLSSLNIKSSSDRYKIIVITSDSYDIDCENPNIRSSTGIFFISSKPIAGGKILL